MSDNPENSGAWTTHPARYLASRPATHDVPDPISLYLEMPDGVKLATDVYIPAGKKPDKGFPALLHLTPYYRRFAVKKDAPSTTEACPNAFKFRDMFVQRGYAMIVVDVRGTGASFGSRDSFRSPTEREDFRTILGWVAAQDWCNGRVGATGISYVGAAADFAATTGHDALKAIAPISAVWDTWLDHLYPGGLLLTNLAQSYDRLMQALDLDQRKNVAAYPYFADPNFAGPAPVDDDSSAALLKCALRDHEANISLADFIREFPHHDSALAYDKSFTPASFSPHTYSESNNRDLAVLSISGWMDGAYMNGAIARFLTLGPEHNHLLLGPWDHGARTNVSPFRQGVEPQFPLLAEILRFFDEYIQQRNTGIRDEAPVHYFSMASEQWKVAESWPPAGKNSRKYFLAPDSAMIDEPAEGSSILIETDFSFGTGRNTRYGRLAALNITDYYASWDARGQQLPRFTSKPLATDMTVSGHPVLTLVLECDQPDAAIIVYLEDVAPDGKRRYVTEGMLRALHRKESNPPETYRANWTYHSGNEKDARSLVPGETATLKIAMLPTSWCFRAGHRIALSLAGADKDNFVRIPYGRPGNWKILLGEENGSRLELPHE